ncbi:hypothetical protein RRG08_016555 [Elysia crispata]|uniref:Uncharacterized protein n=1 Tax=Elysia crispata TaxID=231223 RepID=A0AAE1CYW9_9GAST|nr:hypothetical protein RRG08_016555 [Elysia crispata]
MFKFTTDKTLPTIRLEFLGFSEMRMLYVRTGNTFSYCLISDIILNLVSVCHGDQARRDGCWKQNHSSSQLYELLRALLPGLSNPCGMSEKPYYTRGTMTSASQLPMTTQWN